MTQVKHVATVNAFANKFGTFTGAVRNEDTRAIERRRFATLTAAKHWVQDRAFEMFGPVTFAPLRRKNEYYANAWKRS